MDPIILDSDSWTPEYQPFTYPAQAQSNKINKNKYNSINDNINHILVAGEDNIINSSGIINGINNITGTDSNQFIICGNNNKIGNNCLNVTINGNDNIVKDGVSNVSIQGNYITANVSGITYNTMITIDYYNYIDAGIDVVIDLGSRNPVNYIDAGINVVIDIGSHNIINQVISE